MICCLFVISVGKKPEKRKNTRFFKTELLILKLAKIFLAKLDEFQKKSRDNLKVYNLLIAKST